jgi:hypothetical protein
MQGWKGLHCNFFHLCFGPSNKISHLLTGQDVLRLFWKYKTISTRLLVKDLALRGLKAFYCEDTNLLLDEIIRQGRAGDVILIMSNGAFGNLPARLLKRLEEM